MEWRGGKKEGKEVEAREKVKEQFLQRTSIDVK